MEEGEHKQLNQFYAQKMFGDAIDPLTRMPLFYDHIGIMLSRDPGWDDPDSVATVLSLLHLCYTLWSALGHLVWSYQYNDCSLACLHRKDYVCMVVMPVTRMPMLLLPKWWRTWPLMMHTMNCIRKRLVRLWIIVLYSLSSIVCKGIPSQERCRWNWLIEFVSKI